MASRRALSYASCNGFSDPKLMKSVDDNNRMWAVLAARHVATPLNLLLMGGDQVYADEIWRVISELSDLPRRPMPKR